MIGIVGATGTLGSLVASRLLADGQRVVAITRSPERAESLRSLGAEVRVADLTDRASLDDALRGTDTVFVAAHSLLGRGSRSSQRVDDAGHRAVIDAAIAQRAGHFVYTSVLGAMAGHPADFWRTKFEIELYLKASGLSYTILRPAAFMETHAHELLGKSILGGRTAAILGSGNQRMNFVSARDVAAIAVIVLTTPEARNATIEIGGPDNLTRNQVAELYARVSGRPLRLRHLPVGALRVLATVLGPVHSGISGVMRAAVAFESIDQTFDPTETLRRFPMTLTSIDEFVRERVQAGRS